MGSSIDDLLRGLFLLFAVQLRCPPATCGVRQALPLACPLAVAEHQQRLTGEHCESTGDGRQPHPVVTTQRLVQQHAGISHTERRG